MWLHVNFSLAPQFLDDCVVSSDLQVLDQLASKKVLCVVTAKFCLLRAHVGGGATSTLFLPQLLIFTQVTNFEMSAMFNRWVKIDQRLKKILDLP